MNKVEGRPNSTRLPKIGTSNSTTPAATISAAWIVVAGVCSYAVAYRFYARFIARNLFALDPRPSRAALERSQAQAAHAQATLANARTELARARDLLQVQAVSREEFEQKQAAERNAQADLEAARAAVRARGGEPEFHKG